MSWRHNLALLCHLAVLLGALSGCGPSGAARRQLEGQVKYNGQPILRGEIRFSPDAAKGLDGPQAFAEIKNGRYQTEPGFGAITGPHVVRIIGYDDTKPPPNALFGIYETRADILEGAKTFDFDVPAQKVAAGFSLRWVFGRRENRRHITG